MWDDIRLRSFWDDIRLRSFWDNIRLRSFCAADEAVNK